METIELFNDAIPSLLPPHTVCVLTIWRLNQKTQAGAAGKLQGHVCVPCCVIIVAFGIDRGGRKKRPRPSWLSACSQVSPTGDRHSTSFFFFFDIGLCNNYSICCCAIKNQRCRIDNNCLATGLFIFYYFAKNVLKREASERHLVLSVQILSCLYLLVVSWHEFSNEIWISIS